VTAASGRLGHAIINALSDEMDPGDIVGIARSPEKINCPDIEKRSGDYHSIDDCTEALRGIDTVIMISAPVTPGTDRVVMHRNVIEAAKRAAVRKILFTSVIGNGEEEGTLFFATQNINRQAEEDVKNSGLQWIIGRNGLYIELDLGHILRADQGGVYQNNGATGRCGYISIGELGFAFARLATSDQCNGQILNLTGENRTQAELVDLANQVFGMNVEYQSITDEENIERFMADEKIAARGEEVARMLTGCFQCVRKGAFDVESDFARATGRPAQSTLQQMEEFQKRQ